MNTHTTTIQITKAVLQSLLRYADTTRAAAINALLNGTATNEQRHIVARMIAQDTRANTTATVTRK